MTEKKYKAICYMRVSMKIGMTVENQRPVIEQWLEKNKLDITDVYWVEEQESSSKIRPERDAVFESLLNGTYNLLICVRLDRWGRNNTEVSDSIKTLVTSGCRVVFISNNMDFKDKLDASTMLMVHIFSAFAEFERELIRERVKAGQHRAWDIEHKRKGRPTGSKDRRLRPKSGYYARWIKEKKKAKEKKDTLVWDMKKDK